MAKRVKELRSRKGISQEALANESGLSLRTIQRIENNETVPRGDTLRLLAIALDTSPDEIIDWKIKEDKGFLTMLSLSPLGYLIFPLLGLIISLIMWISKKDKVKHVNELGKSILNFQITLAILYSLFLLVLIIPRIFHVQIDWLPSIHINRNFMFLSVAIFYLFPIAVVAVNAFRVYKGKSWRYMPALPILR